jgi:hypothetical protein
VEVGNEFAESQAGVEAERTIYGGGNEDLAWLKLTDGETRTEKKTEG